MKLVKIIKMDEFRLVILPPQDSVPLYPYGENKERVYVG
jgi:hypothetical protein